MCLMIPRICLYIHHLTRFQTTQKVEERELCKGDNKKMTSWFVALMRSCPLRSYYLIGDRRSITVLSDFPRILFMPLLQWIFTSRCAPCAHVWNLSSCFIENNASKRFSSHQSCLASAILISKISYISCTHLRELPEKSSGHFMSSAPMMYYRRQRANHRWIIKNRKISI